MGDTIAKMAKKGMTPSQIGVLLRDSHGIAQVKSVTGSKILRILKGQGEHPGAAGKNTALAGWAGAAAAGAAEESSGSGIVGCDVLRVSCRSCRRCLPLPVCAWAPA